LWALLTAIFFTWRSKKIKKEGMYYERQVWKRNANWQTNAREA
jgi:hypothetical protein